MALGILSFLNLPAYAFSEKDAQDRFCAGMLTEWKLDGSRGRVDCLTTEYAIEVQMNNVWHAGIGQALWYANETSRKPGVILVCKRGNGPCTRHKGLFRKTLERWDLPITWWYCTEQDETLDACEKVER